MQKKGRGKPVRKRTGARKRTDVAGSFWVFVLFMSAWFAVAFLAVAFFYSAVRWPARRIIPYVPEERGSTELGARVYPDEILDPTSTEQDGEGLPVAEASRSCRALEEEDAEVGLIKESLGAGAVLRQLGDRCVLADGRVLVTFSFNDIVKGSERFYLQQAVGVVRNGSLNVTHFYCRTSPRGAPTVVGGTSDMNILCSFTLEGQTYGYPITLAKDGSIDGVKTLTTIASSDFYRSGTGDTARDLCVPVRKLSALPAALQTFKNALAKSGSNKVNVDELEQPMNVCRLRNGNWVLVAPFQLAMFISPEGNVITSEEMLSAQQVSVIGSEGSFVDVVTENGGGECSAVAIERIDSRTGSVQTLFSRSICP